MIARFKKDRPFEGPGNIPGAQPAGKASTAAPVTNFVIAAIALIVFLALTYATVNTAFQRISQGPPVEVYAWQAGAAAGLARRAQTLLVLDQNEETDQSEEHGSQEETFAQHESTSQGHDTAIREQGLADAAERRDRARQLAREALRRDPLEHRALAVLALNSLALDRHAIAHLGLDEIVPDQADLESGVSGSTHPGRADTAPDMNGQSPTSPPAQADLDPAPTSPESIARARAILVAAADRSLRDLPIQAAYIQLLLTQGAYDDALMRIDALMRGRPEIRQGLMQVLAVIAADPDGRQHLIAYLDTRPPWRSQLIASMAREGEPGLVGLILAGLRAGAAPPLVPETASFLSALIREERYGEAYTAWLGLLTPDEAAEVRFLNNGGFEREPDGMPFDWRFDRLRNVDIRIARRHDVDQGRALRVTFGGGRARFRHVSQTLYLPPGGYRLSGYGKAESLRNPRGLRWRLHCLGSNQRIAETRALTGNTPWSPFSSDFVVPSDCPAQMLRLELDARAALDTEISGSIWYDNLAIDRHAVDVTETGTGPGGAARQ